jgi:putative ABC transport system permease protein
VKIFESFLIAMRSLTANKLRSSLTMLGVIIGVGSVITLMSVGQGAQASITSTIQDMGTNLIYVTSKTPGVEGMMAMANPTYSFTMSDVQAVSERVPGVMSVVPVIENYVEVATASDSTLGVVEATTPEFNDALN